jgi:hypothetical protein
MGAFEAAPPGAGDANSPPVVSRFRIGRKQLSRKRRSTRFRFRLSEAARVVIRIERLARRKRGKRRFVRVRTLKSGEKAGASRSSSAHPNAAAVTAHASEPPTIRGPVPQSGG